MPAFNPCLGFHAMLCYATLCSLSFGANCPKPFSLDYYMYSHTVLATLGSQASEAPMSIRGGIKDAVSGK